MQQLIHYIGQQLSQHFNQHIEVIHSRQVFGGDINEAFRLQTDTADFFLKVNGDHFADMFEKEFDGLSLLHKTGTIRVPKPILQGKFENKIFLVTEFIQRSNPSKNFWNTFAQQLASLHQHSNEKFGLNSDNYIGSLHQPNKYSDTWAEFYSRYRIMPLMHNAFAASKWNKNDLHLAEKLCGRFDILFPQEAPALIHGDLWSGNFVSNENGEPVVFDPAVYYGNREMDIAMSLLFGGFDKSFYSCYNDIFPLQPGWQERIRLCQLYPLLVHLILFGGHYYNSVIDTMKAFC